MVCIQVLLFYKPQLEVIMGKFDCLKLVVNVRLLSNKEILLRVFPCHDCQKAVHTSKCQKLVFSNISFYEHV